MEVLKKELERFAKIIVDRSDIMNQGQGGAGVYSETVDRININTAETLEIIGKTYIMTTYPEADNHWTEEWFKKVIDTIKDADDKFKKSFKEFKVGENKVEDLVIGEANTYNINGKIVPASYKCNDPSPSNQYAGYLVKFYDPDNRTDTIELVVSHSEVDTIKLIEKAFDCVFLPF